MSTTVIFGVISILLTLLGLLNTWLLYAWKSKKDQDKEDMVNLERRANNRVSELAENQEKLSLRISTLEKHSITEAKTKELIDAAIKPLHDGLNEIKQDGREAQKDIKALLIGFSNLLGQLGQKHAEIHKE